MKISFALPLALFALAFGQEYGAPENSTPSVTSSASPSPSSSVSASASSPSASASSPSKTTPTVTSSVTPSATGGIATLPYLSKPLGTAYGTAVGTGGAGGNGNSTQPTGGSDSSRTVSPPKSTDGANSPQTSPADAAGAIATFAPAGLGMGVAGALFAAFL